MLTCRRMFAVLTVFVHPLPASVLPNCSLCNMIVHCCRYSAAVWRYAGALQQSDSNLLALWSKNLALWSNMLAPSSNILARCSSVCWSCVDLRDSMLSLCRVILGLKVIRDIGGKCWPLAINASPEHEDTRHSHQICAKCWHGAVQCKPWLVRCWSWAAICLPSVARCWLLCNSMLARCCHMPMLRAGFCTTLLRVLCSYTLGLSA